MGDTDLRIVEQHDTDVFYRNSVFEARLIGFFDDQLVQMDIQSGRATEVKGSLYHVGSRCLGIRVWGEYCFEKKRSGSFSAT